MCPKWRSTRAKVKISVREFIVAEMDGPTSRTCSIGPRIASAPASACFGAPRDRERPERVALHDGVVVGLGRAGNPRPQNARSLPECLAQHGREQRRRHGQLLHPRRALRCRHCRGADAKDVVLSLNAPSPRLLFPCRGRDPLANEAPAQRRRAEGGAGGCGARPRTTAQRGDASDPGARQRMYPYTRVGSRATRVQM